MRSAVPKAGYVLQALREPLAQRLTLLAVPAVLALVWLRHIWVPRDRTGSASLELAPIQFDAPAPQIVHPWRWALTLTALGALVVLEKSVQKPRPRRGRRRKRA